MSAIQGKDELSADQAGHIVESVRAAVAALDHPTRLRIVWFLSTEEFIASPTRIAERLGLDLPNVVYHVKQLEQAGGIREVIDERWSDDRESYFTVDADAYRVERLATAADSHAPGHR